MSENIGAAKLAITADAAGVEAGVGKAKKSLATLGGAAQAAGKEASAGIDKIGDSAKDSATKVDRETKKIAGSLERAIAAFSAGEKGSSKFYEALAGQRGANVDALRPLLAQLDAMEVKHRAATAAAKATAPAVAQVGVSAAQTAAALRGVPAQFTDIVTSLQGGQAPLTVFLQQGGQLKDMFGGIGPAARALGGYIVGLVNPLTIAAAAVATLGLAYFQGSKEGENFARAVILSGNAAGVTVGQLQQMAERIAGITGTQHAAAEALALFVANGTFAGDTIERFTAVALRMEKDTGQAVAETVKQFAELGRSPVEAATKLNESTNFLSASLAHQIKLLEDQGRVADAAAVAQNAYAAALESRLGSIENRLGLVERAWHGITGAAKSAWDAMLNIGREQTLEQKLAAVSAQIEKGRAAFNPSAFGGNTEARAQLQENLQLQASLQEQLRLQKRGVETRADEAEQAKARLTFDKAGDEFLTKRLRMEKEITKAKNEGAAAGASQAEIDQRIANIRKKYEDKGEQRSSLRLARADVNLDVERIRGEAEKLIGIYSGAERRIDSLRQMGLLSDQEYFEAKRAFINLEGQAKEDALTQEIARLQKEKLTGAEKLQNDKKIADAEAKLAIARADRSSKVEENSARQVQATRREAAEFLAARQAAQDYFDATIRRQNQEIAGIGAGNRQREFDRGANDIRERFGSQRQQLDNQRAQQEVAGTFTDDDRRRYEQRLQVVNEFEQRELASWTDFNQRKLAAEGDWLNGAQEALKNYADQSTNVAGQVEEVFGHAFSSLEDALAQFVQTGKFNFSGLVRSILADIARLEAKQAAGGLAKFASAAFSEYFGGGSPGAGFGSDAELFNFVQGGRAIGGPVSGGGTYQVNERGMPELLNAGGKQFLMMNGQSGSVTPAGGGDVHIVNNTTGRIDRVQEQRTSRGDRVLVLEEVAGALADPNSKVSQAMKANFGLNRNR